MTKSSDFVARVGGIRQVDRGRGRVSSLTHRPGEMIGPVCVGCAHPTCRTARAQSLPRLGGHRSEYAHEHAQAAAIQTNNPHAVVWWGESTHSFWAAVDGGLHEAEDVDALLLVLWTGPDPERETGAVQPPAPGSGRGGSVPAPAPASAPASVPPTRGSAVVPANATNRVPARTGPWAPHLGRTPAEFRDRTPRPRPPSSPHPAPPPWPIPRPRPHPEPVTGSL